MLKNLIRKTFHLIGFDVHRFPKPAVDFEDASEIAHIPDREFYSPFGKLTKAPLFSPWLGYGDFSKYYDLAKSATLVSSDRCWVLYSLCKQSFAIDGDIWECGVYKGGTAAMLAQMIGDGNVKKKLHLFDTFEGMPETDHAVDIHRKGDFSEVDLAVVQRYVKNDGIAEFHQGLIPQTFDGLEDSTIAFAHVDVDIRKSVMDCCDFIFPRLSIGGFMVFDDYGFPTCPGARKAVDEYFSEKNIVPLVLPTGQAVVFKSH